MKLENIKYRYTISFNIDTGDNKKDYETKSYIIDRCLYMSGVNDTNNGGFGPYVTLEESSKEGIIKKTKVVIRYIKRFKGARIE